MAPKKLTPFSIDDILVWEPNKGRKIYLEQEICPEKIILKSNYKSYENALKLIDLETLSERRTTLCL